MKIIAIDDQELALESLTEAIKEAQPSDEVFGFSEPPELLAFAKENDCHIAFLDVEMWGMTGLELAAELKKIKPTINIIFATAYAEYKGDAMDLRASGYVMKPVTKEDVEREIENLRHPVDRKKSARIFVQTFGNFEVFTYGKPLKFASEKAKEIFAYLIDRQGATAKNAELAAVLWEDRTYDSNIASQTRTEISKMMKTFRENNLNDIVIKSRNSIAVDKYKVVCDIFDFLNADASAVNAYFGEYMSNYSWAEFTAGLLMRKTKK